MLLLASLLRQQRARLGRSCAVAANRAVIGTSFSTSSLKKSSSALPRPAATTLPLFFPCAPLSPPSHHYSLTFTRGAKWSVETEKGHKYRNPDEIIDDAAITKALESTKLKAKDPAAVTAVLEAAKERAFLKAPAAPSSDSSSASSSPSAAAQDDLLPEPGPSEFVRGLSLEEAALLLNVDANDTEAMKPIFETAFQIKNRIYGNRVVLFAPLYIANWCVNSCTYCAFR